MTKQKNSALSWVWETTLGLRVRLIVLILTTAIHSASAVLFALSCREVIDGAVSGDRHGLLVGASLLCALILAQLLLRYLNRNLEEMIRARLEIKLKSRVFSALLRKQYRDVTTYHSG